MMEKIVVFDFDGTIMVGDQPYLRCAEIISKKMTVKDADDFLSTVKAALNHSISFPGEDGWSMLASLSKRYAKESIFTEAFHETRKEMLSSEEMTYVPVSVKVLLTEIKPYSILALASNSPAKYVEPVLERYSLHSFFKYILPGAGKPAGLRQLVMNIANLEKLDGAYEVLSIGDHYVNDILPAVESGWDGAFVNPFGLDRRLSTISGESIATLSQWILNWVKK